MLTDVSVTQEHILGLEDCHFDYCDFENKGRPILLDCIVL